MLGQLAVFLQDGDIARGAFTAGEVEHDYGIAALVDVAHQLGRLRQVADLVSHLIEVRLVHRRVNACRTHADAFPERVHVMACQIAGYHEAHIQAPHC